MKKFFISVAFLLLTSAIYAQNCKCPLADIIPSVEYAAGIQDLYPGKQELTVFESGDPDNPTNEYLRFIFQVKEILVVDKSTGMQRELLSYFILVSEEGIDRLKHKAKSVREEPCWIKPWPATRTELVQSWWEEIPNQYDKLAPQEVNDPVVCTLEDMLPGFTTLVKVARDNPGGKWISIFTSRNPNSPTLSTLSAMGATIVPIENGKIIAMIQTSGDGYEIMFSLWRGAGDAISCFPFPGLVEQKYQLIKVREVTRKCAFCD